MPLQNYNHFFVDFSSNVCIFAPIPYSSLCNRKRIFFQLLHIDIICLYTFLCITIYYYILISKYYLNKNQEHISTSLLLDITFLNFSY